jgi:hypothetical protein
MTTSEETKNEKSHAELMAQMIAVHNEIVDLRRSGKIIAQQQDELRESLTVHHVESTGDCSKNL